jgi:hypothetical protein
MSSSPPLSFWYFIGFAALAHVFVPLFLRGLRVQFPAYFDYLGKPNHTTVFSRNPEITAWAPRCAIVSLWCRMDHRR